MAKSDKYQQIVIQLPTHEYPVYIGNHCLHDLKLLQRHVLGNQALIVTNDTIAPLYLKYVKDALSTKQCDVVVLKDGETYKNTASLSLIYDKLIANHHHRDTTLIALGGGVVGDITGFAAATYQRGVSFIQIPTSLLAQVDASIGGKTAINHPQGKNMIGSFHQPDAVIIDLNTLSTLPEREFIAGIAEVIKYSLLAGGDFLESLDASLQEESLIGHLPDLIAECCRIKAEIVQNDEREQGRRALLNLGHTFAHALESVTQYERWLHGEAVAIGLYCAALMSHRLRHLSKENFELVDSLLKRAKLPRRIPKEINLVDLRALMLNDKKVKNNRLRFVLMKAPGDCYLDNSVTDDDLHGVLNDAIET